MIGNKNTNEITGKEDKSKLKIKITERKEIPKCLIAK
jgi:hypothetical protein